MSKRSRHALPLPELFTDRNLGAEVVPKALEECGFVVHRMVDYWGDHLAEVDDSDWIEEVSEAGLVILTKDKRIRTNRLEREAVIRSNARVFGLTGGRLTAAEMAERFVTHRHRIAQRSRRNGPFIYAVGKNELTKLL